jgi:alpha-tubulin suppressor-like RCC1 family protein
MDDVIAVSAGGSGGASPNTFGFSMAVTSDNRLWAWGCNGSGNLGDGTTTRRLEPVHVLYNVAAVSAGGAHTMVITHLGNNSIRAWGVNTFGQLGDGTVEDRSSPVFGLNNVTAISAGWGHSAAIKADGTLMTWGSGISGELGDGTMGAYPEPTRAQYSPISVLENVIAVSAGDFHTVAVTADGTLLMWGMDVRYVAREDDFIYEIVFLLEHTILLENVLG